MAVDLDRLKKQISKTIEREQVGDDSSKKTSYSTKGEVAKAAKGLLAKGKKSGRIPIHKHCSICRLPIDFEAEPPLCDSDVCEEKWKKGQSTQTKLKILLYILLAVAAFPVIGTLLYR